MRTIDLNGDMGEGNAAADSALLEFITSANIACGGHAGSRATMLSAVSAAVARGVAVGAHPGYPDRANFGRIEVRMTPKEIEETVAEQVGELDRVAGEIGSSVGHVKPHGALYHAAMSRRDVAEAFAEGVRRVRPGLVLVGLAGAQGLLWWRQRGESVLAEAFADRRYEDDGFLRSRSLDGAMIEDPKEAAEQAVRIAEGQGVVSVRGSVVEVRAATICIHGDSAGAVEIARAVRGALEIAGVRVSARRVGLSP